MASYVTVEKDGALEITVRLEAREGAGMMELEQQLQDELNGAGRLATGHLLKRFDTDGSPVVVGGIKLTSKGEQNESYQTPYGVADVARHVYQGSGGGRTYCPMEVNARIIKLTTPKFARMCASKYAEMKSTSATTDMADNHGRRVSRCYLQDISAAVAAVAWSKEGRWTYQEPPLPAEVHTISVGVDGTTLLFCEEGYRMAMAGTLALYDKDGDRMHTTYVGVEPEFGKAVFYERMDEEIAALKERYPHARWAGVADGAQDQWPWLEGRTDVQVLDFYHAAGYVSKAAAALCPGVAEREQWSSDTRHSLKENPGGAALLLARMELALPGRKLGKQVKKDLHSAITYFENNMHRMDYPAYQEAKLPIGSGVTEAACKTLVKQRMCGSGMKWKYTGAAVVLTLRSLVLSEGRWDQFWQKIARFGV